MNTPRYAAAAAKLLSKHLPSTANVPAGDRDRGLTTIERALAARTRRRRWSITGGALAAAAALVLVAQMARSLGGLDSAAAPVGINVSPLGQGAAWRGGHDEQPLSEHSALQSGQRIETPLDGGASLQLSTGTAMALAGSTSFQVDSQGPVERFSLQRGVLSAHVAKLTKGQRFIVATPDAEVEVRGTRFRLHVLDHAEACGGGTRTRLQVTEGVVEVRDRGVAIAVKAGEIWPTDCGPEPESAPSPSAAASEPARDSTAPARNDDSAPKAPAGATPSASAKSGASERESALAPANDLFSEGVARRRQGDASGALQVYQELLTRYPRSPLAENALVERMRLLAASGGGPAEARRYLARYPRGFAVQEARKLAAEP